MSSHFPRPENALRKAADFVDVNNKPQAIRTLHGALTSRRHRQWQPVHETVMFMYVDLAVELREGMRDALVQYRMLCQNASWSSMEKVMRHYIDESKKRCTLSQASADAGQKQEPQEQKDQPPQQQQQQAPSHPPAAQAQPAQVAVAGLEAFEDEEVTPNSVMAAAFGSVGDKAPRPHDEMVPWVRYLWETYRTILEVLRNNSKLLGFYHEVARSAMAYCIQYKRTTSFRRLAELLRNHFKAIRTHQHQTNAVDLQSAEAQSFFLQVFFQQLNTSAHLELWQEAYRTIEDIHEVMSITKVQPEPALVVTYYEKLAQIFWASENPLFHAYSMESYLSFTLMANPELPKEQRQRLASAVLVSALCIPPSSRGGSEGESVFNASDEGNLKLATLLGFKKEVPTRERLLNTLRNLGVAGQALPEVAETFELLERGFGPLSLTARLEQLWRSPAFAAPQPIASSDGSSSAVALDKYVPSLRRLATIRLLQQLSRVFSTIRIDRYLALAQNNMDPFEVEAAVMEAAREDLLWVRWDHSRGMIYFSEDRMQADRMRWQLSRLASSLATVARRISTALATADSRREETKREQEQRHNVFSAVKQGLEQERGEVAERSELIERRKQHQERVVSEQQRREEALRVAASEQRAAEERERLTLERQRREQEKLKREAEEHALQEKQRLIEQLKKDLEEALQKHSLDLELTKKIKDMKDRVDKMDREELLKAQREMRDQEVQTKENDRKETAKRHDYWVRASREVERPRLKKSIEERRERAHEKYKEQFELLRKQQEEKHVQTVQEKKRLMRIRPHAQQLRRQMMDSRMQEYRQKRRAQDARLKQKREEIREEEERQQREREEEERRAREQEERERKLQEEAEERERKRHEEEERRRQEDTVLLEKLNRIAELQRQREAEIEARRAAAPGTRVLPEWRRADAQEQAPAVGGGEAGLWRSRRAEGISAGAGEWRRPEAAENAPQEAASTWRRDRERGPSSWGRERGPERDDQAHAESRWGGGPPRQGRWVPPSRDDRERFPARRGPDSGDRPWGSRVAAVAGDSGRRGPPAEGSWRREASSNVEPADGDRDEQPSSASHYQRQQKQDRQQQQEQEPRQQQ